MNDFQQEFNKIANEAGEAILKSLPRLYGMNIILQRIANAIEKGGPWQVKYQYDIHGPGEVWHVSSGDQIIVLLNSIEAEEKCERLNKEFVARAVVECMRDTPATEIYGNYECNDIWQNMTSTKIWQLWIDAILKV